MNEELQSTNEELETINEELHQRTDELNEANAFMHSIIGGLRAGVAVMDRSLSLLTWNHRAEDLWGLRADEVEGQSFFNLDIGLPVDRLRDPIRACLVGETDRPELTVDATNRRGKPIQCRITCTPLIGAEKETRGVIVLMEEIEEEIEIEIERDR